MDQLVNVIFDIKFVIGISVLLVILVIWLIVNTVRSKGFKKELNELKKRYNDIKNVPVQYKMNKVNTLAKMDEDTTKKSKEAQDVYDAYEESIAKITTGLSDADDAISAGKLKKADKIMDMLDEELTKANTSSSVLNDMLDILLAKQTTQRQKVTSYKNTFRALKSEAQEHSMELAYCWDYLETKISSTEQMFSTFEEWMFSNEFERANKENVKIISATGAANKLDPTAFEVADIYKTSMCPVCKILRKELKQRGIKDLKVVYSKEIPIKPKIEETTNERVLGSI